MTRPVDSIISGGFVLTMDDNDRIFEPGAVAIDNRKIVAVGNADDVQRKYSAAERIDAERMAVLPGLVDTYGHAGHGLIRAVWHARHGWPPGEIYFNHTTPDWWYAEARLAAVERLRFGTTTGASVVGATPSRTDDPIYALRTADGYREVGVRCVLGVGPPDPFFSHLPEPWTGRHFQAGEWRERAFSYQNALDVSKDVLAQLSGDDTGRIRGALHPPYIMGRLTTRPTLAHEYAGADAQVMLENAAEMRDLADQFGVQIHTHLFRGSVEFGLRYFGEDMVRSILGNDVVVQHGNGLLPAEVEIVGDTGSNVASVPSTAENILDGFAPVVSLLEAGANVAIATDGSAPRFSFDLWKEIPRAMWNQWVDYSRQDVLPPGKALRMVTIDAARALNWEDEIGSLEPGKRADIVLVNLDQPHLTPQTHVPNLLAFYATGSDVDTVLVDGEVKVRGGEVVGIDLDEILQVAREESERVLELVDLSTYRATDSDYWRSARLS